MKLGLVPEISIDGSITGGSAIRLLHPWRAAAARAGAAVEVLTDLEGAADCDAIVVERCGPLNATDKLCPWIAELRAQGKQVIFSIDDDLMDHYREHGDLGRVHRILNLIRATDWCVVSTIELKQRISSIVSSPSCVTIFPNALKMDAGAWNPVAKRSRQPGARPALCYMGTYTHIQDLESIALALRMVNLRHPFTFHIVGIGDGERIRSLLSGIEVVVHRPPSAAYDDFRRWFAETGATWDIGLCPLIDSYFNLAKSDIKMLDYLAVGMLPLASAVTPYREDAAWSDHGMLVDNTVSAWVAALDRLLSVTEDARNGKLTALRQHFLARRSYGLERPSPGVDPLIALIGSLAARRDTGALSVQS